MERNWSSDLLHAVHRKNSLEIHLAINALFQPAGVQVGILKFPHTVINRASRYFNAQPLILYALPSWDPFGILWFQQQWLPTSSEWRSFSPTLAIKFSPYYRGNTVSAETYSFFNENQGGIDLSWQPPVRLPDACVSSQISQSCISIPTIRRIVTMTTDGSRFILEWEPVLYYDARRPLMPSRFEVLPNQVALVKLYSHLGLSPRSVLDPLVYAYFRFWEYAIGGPYYTMRLLLADTFPQIRERLPITSPWRRVAVIEGS